MYRYFLHLAYNGQAYCGWQVQLNGPSVQATIESALKVLMGSEMNITGCGRTDTGVHSSSYFAHFDVKREIEDAQKLVHQLNGILPDDIAIFEIIPVAENAHARHDAAKRTYRYFLINQKNPHYAGISWRISFPLDHELIAMACSELIGKRDYQCFSKTHTDVTNHICDIMSATWNYNERDYMFEISANRFLRGMVRAIVGTLIDVGKGKVSIDEFKALVESGDRALAGASVPANGLFLVDIKYPFIPEQEMGLFPFYSK